MWGVFKEWGAAGGGGLSEKGLGLGVGREVL